MSRNGVLTIIILILMITPALAKEAAYAYGEFGGHLLDNGNITEFKGSDLINFTVAGGSEGESIAYNESRTMDSIRSEIRQKINKRNQPVRDEGRRLVGKISGPRRIDQICSIYDLLVNNWSYVEDWKGLDEFQYSNYSLEFGKNVDSEGQGDCDDFSILLAALVESIGAAPRIIFAYGPNGGHAYAEVYLGNINENGGDVDRMIKWLRSRYNVREINTHVDLDSGDVWLNLDWWKDLGGANHPGGRFFSAANQMQVYPTSREPRAPLTALNEPPKLLKVFPAKLGLEPRTAGSTIIFNANATDPENDSIYFMFRLNDENVTAWKSTSSLLSRNNSTWSWETNNSHIGSNIIEVWVRDGNHKNENGFDDRSVIRLEIKPAMPVYIWSTAPDTDSFSWNTQDFAGFYYDIDNDIGNEKLSVNITDGAKLSGDPPYGLVYMATAKNREFDFKEWGEYIVIGFLSQKHFAGYSPGISETSNLFYNSSNTSAWKTLHEILIDNNAEATYSTSNPLWLRQGYVLAIKSIDIDGNKIYVELSKDTEVVKSGILIPYDIFITPKTSGKDKGTFSYEKNDPRKIIQLIEVHFKNSIRSADENLATVDRIWQISENDSSKILKNSSDEIIISGGTPLKLDEGYELAIKSMDIEGNSVYLELRKDGQVVESKIVAPPNSASEAFLLTKHNGPRRIIKQIEVHFKNSFRGADENLATVDRIWQISENDSSKILKNSSDEIIISGGTPLKLDEGYELVIKSIDIDGNKIYLELRKDGQAIESRVVIPANKKINTFYYAINLGNHEKLVTIGIHFKNSFRGATQDLATINGIWQISDNPLELEEDMQFDKMIVESIDPAKGIIIMNNKDNPIFLAENNEYDLIQDLKLKTFDQEREKSNHVNFALFKDISLAGNYTLRGSVASTNFSWYPENFPGFLYDLEEGFGTEMIQINLSHNNILSGQDPPYGIIYKTSSKARDFRFHEWGNYKIIGFLGKKYFVKYIDNPDVDDNELPFAQSRDSDSLAKGQLEEILKDENEEISLTSGKSLKLAQGYELVIRSIDSEGKLSLELIKNGSSKDLMNLEPSKNGATMADKTYYYETEVGRLKGITIIAVHFKKAIRVGDRSQAIIDGIWQISDTPTNIQMNDEYDKMRIAKIDPFEGSISMDNRDYGITLKKNWISKIMGDIYLKTADNDTLRYHIYKAVTIGED